jgi:DNA-binding MarR family transcriptional regulator/GNAT superfamily N-acetyltransferase
MTVADELAQRSAAVRRFNRFYTRQIGLLQEGLSRSPFSLTEARVIYELAHRAQPTASELAEELGLDPGYLSRILNGFQKRLFVTRQTSQTDGRQSLLQLTPQGQAAFEQLNADTQGEIEALLSRLSPDDQTRLLKSMRSIEELLGAQPERKTPYILLRPPQPGDMGWVVQRHGALYAQEYGWNEQFEALVAEIVAGFIKEYNPKWERCWIAEVDGERAGSIFLVKQAQGVAKLRLLLVEPQARGLGLGSRLVNECIRQARQMGYQKMTLWTNDVLLAARHIYQKAGFQCVEREPYQGFGHDLVSETWEMALISGN